MITIYDVARRAQVSAMTVSRTLNKPELVRAASKAKVEAAIKELGYRRNQAARSLVAHSTGLIKMQLSFGLRGNHLFFSQLFAGISEILSAHKLALLISEEEITDYAYDGKIVMGLTEEQRSEMKPSNTPKVLFGRGPENIDWVEFDNEAGGRLATEHLISLGHKRIAFLRFLSPEPYIGEREQGHQEALAAAQLPLEDYLCTTAHENTIEAGYEAGMQLLKNSEITAVTCCSDQLANGLIHAAQELGLNVPEDLSVVGFDGIGYERAVRPLLTTVSQPAFEIGNQLASTLVALISETVDQGQSNYWVSPKLIINSSTSHVKK